MKVLDLIRYNPEKGCFVLKENTRPRVLNPWEELAQDPRPSVFVLDPYFRAKKSSGTIDGKEALSFKPYGSITYSQSKAPPKKGKKVAKSKTARALEGARDPLNGQASPDTQATRGANLATRDARKERAHAQKVLRQHIQQGESK